MGISGGRTGLWRGCQAVVDRLELPDPFDAETFIAALAGRRGRPIELIGVPTRPDRPCGLLVTTAGSDLIIYSSDTSAVHRGHILLHEAAHLLREHDRDGAATVGGWGGRRDRGASGGDRDESGGGEAGGISTLLPHLSPALIRSVLGRTVYTEPQEREAELIATMIHHRVARGRPPQPRPPAPRPGIETMFGLGQT